jgi:spore coat protein U-like protein
MRKFLTAAAAAAAMITAAGAYAAPSTITTTFQVSATILKACTVSATALNFGNYTAGGGALNATSTVNVKCTNSTPFTVALNGGTTAGGTVAQRLLANGSNTLQYNLYTASTDATVFGDGTGTSATMPGTGVGLLTAVPVTVYGQLPDNTTNQTAVPGTYTDTITVTVTY